MSDEQTAGPDHGAPSPRPVPGAPDERRVSRLMVWLLALSIAAGVALLALYAKGGQVQLEGTLLFVLLGGIGFSLILWGKYLFPSEIVTEARGDHPSTEQEQLEAELALAEGEDQVTRRSLLIRMLLGAVGALGLAAVFPIRSLGPSPGRALFETAWTPGALVVDESGQPVRVDDLAVGGVLTVFPEGFTDRSDSSAILVRVESDLLALPGGRNRYAPEGNICYSKLCTHVGCPVGLYLSEYHQLQCPCHFSAFNVLNGAQPVFGPAARPLPQLLIYADGQGLLHAKGDFSSPVGPGFWTRGDGS